MTLCLDIVTSQMSTNRPATSSPHRISIHIRHPAHYQLCLPCPVEFPNFDIATANGHIDYLLKNKHEQQTHVPISCGVWRQLV